METITYTCSELSVTEQRTISVHGFVHGNTLEQVEADLGQLLAEAFQGLDGINQQANCQCSKDITVCPVLGLLFEQDMLGYVMTGLRRAELVLRQESFTTQLFCPHVV